MVLSVDPSILYIIGNPEDPVVVWKKIANQYEKRTWARRLDLRRKLHSMKFKEGIFTQAQVKEMTELFDLLSVAAETVSEEDRVVHLLGSLPESYNVLVTALEANEEVPKLEVVTERILHQERKAMDKSCTGVDHAMTSHKFYKQKPKKCLHYGKMGHSKKFCWELKKG